MNASGRLNTCKSNGQWGLLCMTSGERVRNAYITYLLQGDTLEKFGIIFYGTVDWHQLIVKARAVIDGYASD